MHLRIREHRKARKLRIIDLAAALHVSPPTVHRWEVGAVDPSIGDLSRIAAILHVPLTALLPHDTARSSPEEVPHG